MMTAQQHWPVAIIGSGDVGADLRMKITHSSGPLRLGALPDVRLVLVTGAGDWDRPGDNRVLDLTPAGPGPVCVPAVNLDDHLDAPEIGLGNGAAQAAVPIVAAVGRSGIVSYAEVVTSISARSAGPDARATIDESNQSTAAALEAVGGAQRGKAVLLLNPADPPTPMRNTVYCLVDGPVDQLRIETDVRAMVDKVAEYAPGYRLKHRVQFETFDADNCLYIPETGKFTGTKVTVLLEVAVVGGHLPAHAGSIDMVTSAALVTAERIATHAGEIIGVRA
jgi:acetaldehyde dehydrogenase